MTAGHAAMIALRDDWYVDAECVVPINDLRPHDAYSVDCWCRPLFQGEALVHNSADRREDYEDGVRKVS